MDFFADNKMPIIGCVAAVFDLFHAGHVKFLRKCKEQCDILLVGLHNDETVEQYKRIPIIDSSNRKIVVEACKYVDGVIENMPLVINEQFFSKYKIDIFFYATVNEEEDERYKAKYFTFPHEKLQKIPYTDGISTTNIIKKARNIYLRGSSYNQ